jgi:hypothetical protein
MPQPGFFELDERFKKLDEKDPLVSLNGQRGQALQKTLPSKALTAQLTVA